MSNPILFFCQKLANDLLKCVHVFFPARIHGRGDGCNGMVGKLDNVIERGLLVVFVLLVGCQVVYSQCPDCGSGTVDPGETNVNCPQDVPHGATCTSPCAQPNAFEATAGIRTARA